MQMMRKKKMVRLGKRLFALISDCYSREGETENRTRVARSKSGTARHIQPQCDSKAVTSTARA